MAFLVCLEERSSQMDGPRWWLSKTWAGPHQDGAMVSAKLPPSPPAASSWVVALVSRSQGVLNFGEQYCSCHCLSLCFGNAML